MIEKDDDDDDNDDGDDDDDDDGGGGGGGDDDDEYDHQHDHQFDQYDHKYDQYVQCCFVVLLFCCFVVSWVELGLGPLGEIFHCINWYLMSLIVYRSTPVL